MKICLYDHKSYGEHFRKSLNGKEGIELKFIETFFQGNIDYILEQARDSNACFFHVDRGDFKEVVNFKIANPSKIVHVRAFLGLKPQDYVFPHGIKRYGGTRDVDRYLSELLDGETEQWAHYQTLHYVQ